MSQLGEDVCAWRALAVEETVVGALAYKEARVESM